MTVYCFNDKQDSCEALAAKISDISSQVLLKQRFFSLVLSGGSTPRYLYELLASPKWQDKINWHRAHVFFGDERCVSPDHPDSNFLMAMDAMLKKLPIPGDQIHRIHGENRVDEEALRYQLVIESYFRENAADEPLFDLILLGLGGDGHTASLFPGDRALFNAGMVTPVAAPTLIEPSVQRISLTFSGIALSRNICFLVDGASKSKIVEAVLADDSDKYPASVVQRGKACWFISGIDCGRLKNHF